MGNLVAQGQESGGKKQEPVTWGRTSLLRFYIFNWGRCHLFYFFSALGLPAVACGWLQRPRPPSRWAWWPGLPYENRRWGCQSLDILG